MMYSARRVFLRFVQLASLAALAVSVPAFAQFEVSPDHFDSPSPEKKPVVKSSATKAKTQSAALPSAKKQQTHGAGQPVIASKAQSNGSPNSGTQGQATAATSSPKTQAAVHKKQVVPEKVAVASNR